MPEKNNTPSNVNQDFDRLRSENQVPLKPNEGLSARDSDFKLTTTYGPDPESPSDELMSVLKKGVESNSTLNFKSFNIPPLQENDVVPKVDTKAGPGLEHLGTALDKDVDPFSAVNAEEEK